MTTTSGGGTLSLIHGNALAIPLADQSVHLVVTSPPYFALRDYRTDDDSLDDQLGSEPTPHHFLAALWQVLDECWRILRDDGSCWVNLGDKFCGYSGKNWGHGRDLGRSERSDSRVPIAGPVSAPTVYGLRNKSRMLLPGRFAHGLIDPAYRRFEEAQAGLTPTVDPPQWICRMDVVQSKVNGLPESVTDRVRASHETWFHLVKSERYFASMDEIREEAADRGGANGATTDLHTSQLSRKWNVETREYNALGKLPGSVWEWAAEPLQVPEFVVARYPGELEPVWMGRDEAWRWMRSTGCDSSPWPQAPEDGRQLRLAPAHFAAFGSWPIRRIVAGWSPSGVCVACGQPRRPVCERRLTRGRERSTTTARDPSWQAINRADWTENVTRTITGYACACPTPDAPTRPSVVVDPFSGTGTAPIVAAAMGRHGVGVDLSWDYHRIARWRDRDGGLRAKALGVDRPERQVPGQLSLLDGAP